mmetsp:Transcript_4355/g.15081  ORF Transcript_4355/g.15081 Transcript_4355/m.15081 type:complete len:203 (-) Transcript_4355:812-1420(-)
MRAWRRCSWRSRRAAVPPRAFACTRRKSPTSTPRRLYSSCSRRGPSPAALSGPDATCARSGVSCASAAARAPTPTKKTTPRASSNRSTSLGSSRSGTSCSPPSCSSSSSFSSRDGSTSSWWSPSASRLFRGCRTASPRSSTRAPACRSVGSSSRSISPCSAPSRSRTRCASPPRSRLCLRGRSTATRRGRGFSRTRWASASS